MFEDFIDTDAIISELRSDCEKLAMDVYEKKLALKGVINELTEALALCKEAKIFILECKNYISDSDWQKIIEAVDEKILDELKKYHNIGTPSVKATLQTP